MTPPPPTPPRPTPPRLVLASTSPRRRELLALFGLPFDVVASRFDEDSLPPVGLAPADYVIRLASGKAAEVAARTQGNALVLGADTTVVLDGDFLGKPADAEDARAMLRRLSGRTHQVYTGLCLVPVQAGVMGDAVTDAARTDVTFDPIPEDALRAYVATDEPLDKAGAYGIQGRALSFIPAIHGDYFNVVGLPLELLRALLLPYFSDIKPAPVQPIFPMEYPRA